jgi:transposase-like protein
LKKSNIKDGARPGLNEAEKAELRALKKRTRLLEQENEILRRAAIYFARDLRPK